jgi:hypothetical protein
MKKTIVISLITLATSVYAQIKVFPGGLQSYGSTTAPTGAVKHRFSGDVVVGSSATSTESAYIRGNNTTSTAGSPDYTWLSNNTTGLFHPATNTIGFTIAGYERCRLNTNGQLVFSNSASTWNPDISWLGDEPTGIYHPASNMIGFTIGGTEAMRVSANRNLLLGGTGEMSTRFVSIGASNNAAIAGIASHTSDYQYCQINYVNRTNGKVYGGICTSTGSNVEVFFVKGNGDVWSKTNYYYSDQNLKENIDSLQNSLNKIKQLKGVKYNFKSSFVGQGPVVTELGLLAQDVEAVIPEAVAVNDKGIKGIAYQNLIPVLIEAIKELDAKNTKLQEDLNSCCTKASGGKNRTIKNDDGSSSTDDTKSYMKQNKPNPFNKETVIEYNIVESGSASILVFDMNGRLLKTIPVKIPGQGSITINASDFKAGMYYYSLIVNDVEIDTKKMILTE